MMFIRLCAWIIWAGLAMGQDLKIDLKISETKNNEQTSSEANVELHELSETELYELFQRLPDLPAEPETGDVVLREESMPPPRPGQDLELLFANNESSPPLPPDSGPLKIIRSAPQGERDQVTQIQIAFNQDVVPLTSLDEIDRRSFPISLQPETTGRWRWIDPRTLVFDSESVFPRATEYQVTVSQSLTSLSGNKLLDTVAWKFTTPAPKVTRSYPQGKGHVLDPLFAIEFDQDVDANDLVKWIRVHDSGRRVPVMAVNQADLSELDCLRVKGWNPNRIVLFKAKEPLNKNRLYEVILPVGLASLEGPRKTEQEKRFSFQTYEELSVASARCGWQDRCEPGWPWHIQFSNQLDEQKFSEDMVHVEPALEDMMVHCSGNTLTIQGRSVGGSKYLVQLSPQLSDVFGQELGKSGPLNFNVGHAQPQLRSGLRYLHVLDPFVDPIIPLACVNIDAFDVKVFTADPSEWSSYHQWLRASGKAKSEQPPFADLIAEKRFPGSSVEDQWSFAAIDLQEWLPDGKGQLIVSIAADDNQTERSRKGARSESVVWIQGTELAIDAFYDGSQVVAWVTQLRDGTPVAEVDVSLFAGQPSSKIGTAVTDENGLATLDVPLVMPGPALLVAETEDDRVFLPEHPNWWSSDSRWRKQQASSQPLWYVFDDRGLYKPNERGEVKGWIRYSVPTPQPKLRVPSGSVSYQLVDARGQEIAKGSVPLSLLGGFQISFELADNVNLGSARLNMQHDGTSYTHVLRVEEFRRPEFEVRLQRLGSVAMVGEQTDLQASAKYFSGSALAGVQTHWTLTCETGSYQPPRWPEYQFGEATPWWRWYDNRMPIVFENEGLTKADGSHTISLAVDSIEPFQPVSIQAEVAVTDLNRQQWTDQTQFILHPASIYVGLRQDRGFYRAGNTMSSACVVTDLDGNLVSDRLIEFDVTRSQWVFENRRWQEKSHVVKTFTLKSGDEPEPFSLELTDPGSYRIKARVVDAKDRTNETVMSVWVSGGTAPPSQSNTLESVTIIADKDRYEPGDVASLYLRLPFKGGHGVVMAYGNGSSIEIPFTAAEDEATIDVPIGPYTLNTQIQVMYAGVSPRDDTGTKPPIPKTATGQQTLIVSRESLRLDVQVTTNNDVVVPGAEVEICVAVKDADGKGVKGAEICLFAVDEAVLSLTSYQLGDPLSAMTARPFTGGFMTNMRELILVVTSEMLEAQEERPEPRESMMRIQGFEDSSNMIFVPAPGEASSPITVRKVFDALAFFEPNLLVNDDGKVCVRVKLPDSATRYRIMAVAATATDQFGSGDANLTARLPLLVRPSMPRFLNYGDKAELPVVLQNGSLEAQDLSVGFRSTSSLKMAVQGYQLRLEPEQRVEVRFPAEARAAGTATIQVAVSSQLWSDAAQLEIPVWTPATREGFAYYGSLEAGQNAFHQVMAPDDVLRDYGGLDISLSATQLHALSDAYIYIWNYPYACTEQLATRTLSSLAIEPVIYAFNGNDIPTKKAIQNRVVSDIRLISERQSNDGGFSYWRADRPSDPYLSAHATYALWLAKEMGYESDESVLNRAKNYLRRVHNDQSIRAHLVAKSYALFVRQLMGDNSQQDLAQLTSNTLTDWPVDALSFCLLAAKDLQLVVRLSTELGARVRETAGSAEYVHGVQKEAPLVLASDRRSDALGMWAAMESGADSALIFKLVRGLLGHRVKGRWANTQENVFVLLALTRYFERFEKEDPDLLARTWIGINQVADTKFEGRQAVRFENRVPMKELAAEENVQLAIQSEGKGRLFYRLGLDYAPASLTLEARRQGFTVNRTYEAVDEGDVLKREDGSWWIRTGADVRVKLTMVVPEGRNHVALVDALPAGLEPGGIERSDYASIRRHRGWSSTWYEHSNIRDERVEAFASRLGGGVYELNYLARATTPGHFIVPPARAEEMYEPETVGRSSSDHVEVSESP